MKNTSLQRRISAMIYDGLLVLALIFLTTIPFIAVRSGEPVETNDNLFYKCVLLGVVFSFFVGFWMKSGRTLGMQSWRLQLIGQNGKRPNFSMATIRFFAALLSWLPFGLGFLWQLWDKEQLTWHDRISKSHIVHYPKDKG